jgi:hypothetical protein
MYVCICCMCGGVYPYVMLLSNRDYDLKALCGPFHTIVRDDTGFEEVVCYHFSTHAFIKSYCLVSLVLLVVQLMKAYMTETSLFYTIDICTTLESC